jgi:hypothetical protein
MESSTQFFMHLLIHALCFYILFRIVFRKAKPPSQCLEERGLKLVSDEVLNEAEFRILMNKPMSAGQMNKFFRTFGQYFEAIK